MADMGFEELLMQLSHVIEERAAYMGTLDELDKQLKAVESLQEQRKEIARRVETLQTQTIFLTSKIVPVCQHPYEWRAGRGKTVCILCSRKVPAYLDEEDDDDEYDY